MHRENFLVDDSRNGQAVEAIGECLPQLDVIPPLAFIIEPIYTIDRCTLVIPTQDEEILWILDLVCEKQANSFKRLFASINVVSKEEVICFGWKSSVFKEAEKVVILAMNIPTDLQRVVQCVSIPFECPKDCCKPRG